MALRKNFNDGSEKYHYAAITSIGYTKNQENPRAQVESNLQVSIRIRDDSDPDINDELAPITFKVPHKRLKKIPRKSTEVRANPDGSPALDKNGDPIIDEIIIGEEQVFDDDFIDPLDLKTMRKKNEDILSLGYKYLKTKDFFKDYEDVFED